jgi:hypothetical protein
VRTIVAVQTGSFSRSHSASFSKNSLSVIAAP